MPNKIDVHTHFVPREIPDFRARFGYGRFLGMKNANNFEASLGWSDGTFFRKIGSECWDIHRRIEDCDKNGIAIQVLSPMPAFFHGELKPEHTAQIARWHNDTLWAEIQKMPERFKAFGMIPMNDAKLAIKELEHCKKLGFSGIEIGTRNGDQNLNAPSIVEILACAEALCMPIFVHPWEMAGSDRMPQYWLPWLVGMPADLSLAICSLIFGGVFEKLPTLQIAFAHGGGSFCGTLGRIERGFYARPDLVAIDNPHPPRKYLGRFYVDSLVFDPHVLTHIIQTVGEDHVMLGSDYPFPLGEEKPGELVESMGLIPKTQDKLFFLNASNFMNLG